MIKKILALKVSLILAISATLAITTINDKSIENKYLRQQVQVYKQVTDKVLGIDIDKLSVVTVTVTSYNPTRKQTDNTPLYGNDGELVVPGILAISSDLRNKYNIHNGDVVLLGEFGKFIVKDSMHPRWRKRVDIISFSKTWSEKFGAKTGVPLYFNRRN